MSFICLYGGMFSRRVGNSAASSLMKITNTLSKPERYINNIITLKAPHANEGEDPPRDFRKSFVGS